MNTTFEKSVNTTDEWYTPKEIIDALGKFDLDPCAPVKPLWQTATQMYNKNHDGLKKEGWINIYEASKERCIGAVYNSKETAMRMKVNEKDITCITTVRVEWEE